MQTAETILHHPPNGRAAGLSWQSVSLMGVLGRTDYVTFLTTVIWFALIAVCVWWAMFAGNFPWNIWPVNAFGVQLVFGFYLPWSVCVLLVMWFGLEWAVVPAYLATLFGALHAHMPLDLAVVNALHNPLAMAVYFLFYCGLPNGYALRSAKSWLWFGGASLLAALVSSIGAFISEYNTAVNSAALWASWLGWWPNALGQSLLINAPLIWLCSPAVERLKARYFPRSPRDAFSMQKLLLVASLFILCLALFILLDERWTNFRAGNIFSGSLSADLRAQIQAQLTLQNFVIWVLALVLAAVSLGGVIIASRWSRRLRMRAELETLAARAALERSEARFRHFFHNNPAPMWVYDPKDGHFLEVNDAAVRQYGYAREEFLGMTIFDIRSPEEAERLRKIRATEASDRNWEAGEWRHRCKDGSALDVEVHVSSLRMDDRVVHLALMHDISLHRLVEAAMEQRARELRILAAASLEIAGTKTVGEVLQITADRARQLIVTNLALARSRRREGEDGIVRRVSLGPQYSADAEFQTAVDDVSTCKLLAGKSPLRLGRDEIRHHPLFRDLETRHVARLPLSGLLAVPLITAGRTTGVLVVSDKTQGEFDAQDEVLLAQLVQIASVGIENVRLSEALRNHMHELEQRVAERTAELDSSNRELDAFAYSVAHDLRAPLRAMHGFADALREDYGAQLDETGRGYLARIVKASQNMDTLIQDLLAYSRIGRAHLALEPVALDEVVHDAVAELAPEAKMRQASIRVEVPPLTVEAHRGVLKQVIANLLSNALKFVAPGVRPEVCVRAEAHDGRVHLAVSDNGIGIAPQHRERIFDVFERLHGAETYPGTGVGLSIVKKGLTRMHGDIGVESGERGSTFTVSLKEFRRE